MQGHWEWASCLFPGKGQEQPGDQPAPCLHSVLQFLVSQALEAPSFWEWLATYVDWELLGLFEVPLGRWVALGSQEQVPGQGRRQWA